MRFPFVFLFSMNAREQRENSSRGRCSMSRHLEDRLFGFFLGVIVTVAATSVASHYLFAVTHLTLYQQLQTQQQISQASNAAAVLNLLDARVSAPALSLSQSDGDPDHSQSNAILLEQRASQPFISPQSVPTHQSSSSSTLPTHRNVPSSSLPHPIPTHQTIPSSPTTTDPASGPIESKPVPDSGMSQSSTAAVLTSMFPATRTRSRPPRPVASHFHSETPPSPSPSSSPPSAAQQPRFQLDLSLQGAPLAAAIATPSQSVDGNNNNNNNTTADGGTLLSSIVYRVPGIQRPVPLSLFELHNRGYMVLSLPSAGDRMFSLFSRPESIELRDCARAELPRRRMISVPAQAPSAVSVEGTSSPPVARIVEAPAEPAPTEESDGQDGGLVSSRPYRSFLHKDNEEMIAKKDYWPFQSAEDSAQAVLPFQPKLMRYDWCRDCVDVVIPYVNGSDPWYTNLVRTFADQPLNEFPMKEAAGKARFRDHDELLYCLRSVFAKAPWIRYIHILTNGEQRPLWLTSHPRVRTINHEGFFRWKEHQPTFNIYAIKMHLHRIPDLAPKFIYIEDDQFLGPSFSADTFYDRDHHITYHFSQLDMLIAPEGTYLDNSEWKALRRTTKLLAMRFPSQQSHYPVHGPFFVHRDVYREALEEVWPNEARESSAERFRGPLAIEARLLVPQYQRLRHNGEKRVKELLTHPEKLLLHYFDLNENQLLDDHELLGLSEFLAVPRAQLKDWFQGQSPVPKSSFEALIRDTSSGLYAAMDRALMDLEARQTRVSHDVPDRGQPTDFVALIDNPGQFERDLLRMSARNPSLFCINDLLSEDEPNPKSELYMREFLEWYYPNRSPVEKEGYNLDKISSCQSMATVFMQTHVTYNN